MRAEIFKTGIFESYCKPKPKDQAGVEQTPAARGKEDLLSGAPNT